MASGVLIGLYYSGLGFGYTLMDVPVLDVFAYSVMFVCITSAGMLIHMVESRISKM